MAETIISDIQKELAKCINPKNKFDKGKCQSYKAALSSLTTIHQLQYDMGPGLRDCYLDLATNLEERAHKQVWHNIDD